MPITLGAIRKQRADKRKAVVNLRVKSGLREVVAQMRKKPSKAILATVFRRLDRAAKSGVVHENKAARLKSRLSKLLTKK
jgi:small subunit ribosomal protein S20